jgi:hypothetical protein
MLHASGAPTTQYSVQKPTNIPVSARVCTSMSQSPRQEFSKVPSVHAEPSGSPGGGELWHKPVLASQYPGSQSASAAQKGKQIAPPSQSLLRQRQATSGRP